MGYLLTEPVHAVEFANGIGDRPAARDDQNIVGIEPFEVRPKPRAEPRVVVEAAADLHDDEPRRRIEACAHGRSPASTASAYAGAQPETSGPTSSDSDRTRDEG